MYNDYQNLILENSIFLNEAVKYRFWTRFKDIKTKHPEVSSLEKDVKLASNLMNKSNEEYIEKSNEVISALKQFIRVYFSISGFINQYFGFLTFGITFISAAINKLFVACVDSSDFEKIEPGVESCIKDLKSAKSKIKDKEKQKEMQDLIDRLERKLDKARDKYDD